MAADEVAGAMLAAPVVLDPREFRAVCHDGSRLSGDLLKVEKGDVWLKARGIDGPVRVRASDLRDPYHPKEIGYFIPSITEATDKRCVKVDGKDRCKVAIQTNNVETDDRGYVYIVDRANTGMHILELEGTARQVAGLK